MNNLSVLLISCAIVLLFVLGFWMISIQKYKKTRDETIAFQNRLQPDDDVVLGNGLHGKIRSIDKTTACVEIADGIIVTVERLGISRKLMPQNKEKK